MKKIKELTKGEAENICFSHLCDYCPLSIHTKYRDICGRVILSKYEDFMLSFAEFLESEVEVIEERKET